MPFGVIIKFDLSARILIQIPTSGVFEESSIAECHVIPTAEKASTKKKFVDSYLKN